MADLVIRLDLATEELLDLDDKPDRHKVAATLRDLAQRIEESGGNVYQLNGEPFGVRTGSMIPAGTIKIEY